MTPLMGDQADWAGRAVDSADLFEEIPAVGDRLVARAVRGDSRRVSGCSFAEGAWCLAGAILDRRRGTDLTSLELPCPIVGKRP